MANYNRDWKVEGRSLLLSNAVLPPPRLIHRPARDTREAISVRIGLVIMATLHQYLVSLSATSGLKRQTE